METRQPAAYTALLMLSAALSVLAIVTLVPNPSASKPNVLGYRSVCSYAPAATALCGLLAGITCTIRNRLVSRRRASTRYRPLFVPAAVALALAGIAIAGGVAFGRAQERFDGIIAASSARGAQLASIPDGVRRGAASEGEVAATVEITATGGRMVSLRLVDAANVEPNVAERLFAAVTASQSTRVDAVSGATASSNVLLRAIEAAAGAAR